MDDVGSALPSPSSSSPAILNLAGKKLRNKLSSRLNESASMGVSSFARRQLLKMGWKEGTGLGKRRDGMATHISVQRREDEQGGLGKTSEAAALHGTHDWWKNSLESTLSSLSKSDNDTKKTSKNKKKKKKSDKDKKMKKSKEESKKRKKTYTDEELFQATGGARFGMRAQAPQRGKWQRSEQQGDEETLPSSTALTTKAEWDGRGDAKLILSLETLLPSKRTSHEVSDGKAIHKPEEYTETVPAKKRRKLAIEESGQETQNNGIENDKQEDEKLSKKEKKELKKKKRKNKGSTSSYK